MKEQKIVAYQIKEFFYVMKNVKIDVLRLSCLHIISVLFFGILSALLVVGCQSDLYKKELRS